MLKGKLKLLVLSAFILSSYLSFGANKIIPLNEALLKSLVPSNTRNVVSLSEKWEKSYNDEDWMTVNLPQSEANSSPVYFRKVFKIPSDMVNKYNWHLMLVGLDDEVEVYMNNQFVGKYFGGMIPLNVDIPSKMIFSETNTLKLVVNSAKYKSFLIKTLNVFTKRVYTGIVRDVLLIGTPQVWISHVRQRSIARPGTNAYDVKATVSITAAELDKIYYRSDVRDSFGLLSSSKTRFTVEMSLRDKQSGNLIVGPKSQVVELERERSASLDFDFSCSQITQWSPSTPYLYELVFKVSKDSKVIDDFSTNLGFSNIATASRNNLNALLVNGYPFVFKGVDYVEDYYYTGQTLTAKRMKEDVLMMKTLGVNVVRFKYGVPHPYFVSLCDEYGLFVLLEHPVYNIPTSIFDLDEIKVRLKNTTNRILNSYDVHPSILAYGVSEGLEEGGEPCIEYFKETIKSIKAYSAKMIFKIISFGSKSLYLDGFDFIGVSDHVKYRTFESIKQEYLRIRSLVKGKPIFANFGTTLQLYNNNGYSDPLSIQFQAYYIKNLFDFIHDNDFIGSIIWSFNDYELQNPYLNINNPDRYLSTSGIVDRQRGTRLSYELLQSLFNEEKEPLLDAGSYSEDTPLSFIIVGLILAIVLVFFINRNRRFREYMLRTVLRPYNFYADIRDQRIMSTVQTILLGLGLSIALAVFVSSLLYFYRTSENAEFLIMMLFNSNGFRETVYDIIWSPWYSIFMFSLVIFGSIFLFAGLIKLFSFIVRPKIWFSDTLKITVWAFVPTAFLLPISIILVRLLVLSSGFIYFIALLAISIKIWVLLRIMRATAVVFDVPQSRSYIVGFACIVAFLTVMLTLYNYDYSFFAYFQYFIKVMLFA